MLLSIIVPVYNGEKSIERCLKSLIAIDEEQIEFIIVNDGSTDHTNEICKKYCKIDSRIKLVEQNNSGVSVARNTGIALCKGKYIGFVDSDDELVENFKEILQIIKSIDSDFYMFEHYVQAKGQLYVQKRYRLNYGKNEKREIYNNFLTGKSNCVWNNIYRAEIIKNNNIFFPEDMKMGEDCLFNAQYLKLCNDGYYIDEIGYMYYANNEGSASVARKVDYLDDYIKIYKGFQMIYNSLDNLNFAFYCPYYIDNVYEILKNNKTGKDKKAQLKNSEFYRALMKYRCNSMKQIFRKLSIKVFLL